MTSRNYCITWNNPPALLQTDPEQIENLIAQNDEKKIITYAVWQLERAETTGTVHFQMYVELKSPQRFTYLKKVFKCETLHCEPRKGTASQARAYCMKVDTRIKDPCEYGVLSKGQGSRSDLETVVNLAKEGKNILDVYEEVGAQAFRFEKYFNSAKATFSALVPRVKPEVVCHWGESGTGKTYDAIRGLKPTDYFIKRSGKWWDGYHGQKIVIIDEIVPTTDVHWYNMILGVCDEYQMQVEVKGGTTFLVPERIFLTSNFHPRDWFPNVAIKEPLFRRISRCVHYTGRFGVGVEKTEEILFPVPVVPTFNLPAPVVNGPPPVQEEEIITLSDDEEEENPFASLQIPSDEELGIAFSEEI